MIASEWLDKSAIWRFTSLLFQPPSTECTADLAALARELPEKWRARAAKLAGFPPGERETEYQRFFGPGGIPASESSFEENALAGRGPVIARIAGYYDAFAYRPRREGMETPDHVSVELGFLSYLALKAAFVSHSGLGEELKTTQSAYRRFLTEHAHFWFPSFAERLAEVDSPFYQEAARWLKEITVDSGNGTSE